MKNFEILLEKHREKIITLPMNDLILLVQLEKLDAQEELLRRFPEQKNDFTEMLDTHRRRILHELLGEDYVPEMPLDFDQYLLRYHIA